MKRNTRIICLIGPTRHLGDHLGDISARGDDDVRLPVHPTETHRAERLIAASDPRAPNRGAISARSRPHAFSPPPGPVPAEAVCLCHNDPRGSRIPPRARPVRARQLAAAAHPLTTSLHAAAARLAHPLSHPPPVPRGSHAAADDLRDHAGEIRRRSSPRYARDGCETDPRRPPRVNSAIGTRQDGIKQQERRELMELAGIQPEDQASLLLL